jgi:hypothetical protein
LQLSHNSINSVRNSIHDLEARACLNYKDNFKITSVPHVLQKQKTSWETNIPLLTTLCFSRNPCISNAYGLLDKLYNNRFFHWNLIRPWKLKLLGECWRRREYSGDTKVQQQKSKDYILNNVRKQEHHLIMIKG